MPEASFKGRGFETSRRQLIRRATVLVGAAGLVGAGLAPRRAFAAPAKTDPKVVSYQATPKGDARCELCANWQAPNACKLVAGPISPSGWCSLFARKT